MSMIRIRKKSLNIETVWHEGGPVAAVPLRLGSAVAVVENPFAGRYVENLDAFVADARELANQLTAELVAALGGPKSVEAYGKGAIVGVAGELEHGAIWHEAGGWAMRAALDSKAIVPAAKAVASAGFRLHVPLHHVNAAYVRSHFNVFDIGFADAPRPNELVYGLVMATGPRIHERLGGLRADQISVHDGQR